MYYYAKYARYGRRPAGYVGSALTRDDARAIPSQLGGYVKRETITVDEARAIVASPDELRWDMVEIAQECLRREAKP